MNSLPTQSLTQISNYVNLIKNGVYDYHSLASKNVAFDFSLASSASQKQVEFLMNLVSMGASTHPSILDLFLDHDFTEPLLTKRILDCAVCSVNRYFSNLFINTKRSVMLPEYACKQPLYPISIDLRVGECMVTYDINESFYGARIESQQPIVALINGNDLSESNVAWLDKLLLILEHKRESIEFCNFLLIHNAELALSELTPNEGTFYPERINEAYEYIKSTEEDDYDPEVLFKLLLKCTNLESESQRNEYKSQMMGLEMHNHGYLSEYHEIEEFISSIYICNKSSIKNTDLSLSSPFWQKVTTNSLFDLLNEHFNSIPSPSNEIEEKLVEYLLTIKPTLPLIKDSFDCEHDELNLSNQFYVGVISDETQEFIFQAIDFDINSKLEIGQTSWSFIKDEQDLIAFIKYRGWLDGLLETLINITKLDT